MSKIDDALVSLRENMDNARKQMEFYDLFLNANFFVPILADLTPEVQEGTKEVAPVITEADGKDYLMIFDSLERLKDWATEEGDGRYIEVPGHVLALNSAAPLHWALNVGTEFSKQFHPEEIAWLRQAVERCNADAAAEAAGKE